MKIYLLDNAIDSFEWSLRHLRTFLRVGRVPLNEKVTASTY